MYLHTLTPTGSRAFSTLHILNKQSMCYLRHFQGMPHAEDLEVIETCRKVASLFQRLYSTITTKDWSCPFQHCSCICIYYYIQDLRYIHICSSQSLLKWLNSPCVSITPLFAVLPLEITRTTRANQKTSKVNGSEKAGTRRWVIISSHDFMKRRDSRPWRTASPMVRVRSMYSLGYLVLYANDLASLQSFPLYNPSTFPLELARSHSRSFPALVMIFLPVVIL